MHEHCTRACAQHSSTLATPIDFMGSLVFEDHTKIRSKMASFSVEAMVRGHHVYQDIWTAKTPRTAVYAFPRAMRLCRRSKVASRLNFRLFKISQFLISYVQRTCEIYENLHHTNISRYTVSKSTILCSTKKCMCM